MKMNGRLLASSLTLFLVFFSNMVFAAASEAYKLGTGDRVKVMVYGQEDLTTEAEVAGDGTITMPLVGRVEIRGMSPQDAGDLIGRQLEQRGYLKRAHVNLLIEQYRSNTVSILGQVNHPGRIALEGPTSLTEALALAGGINDTGSERIILVISTMKVASRVRSLISVSCWTAVLRAVRRLRLEKVIQCTYPVRTSSMCMDRFKSREPMRWIVPLT